MQQTRQPLTTRLPPVHALSAFEAAARHQSFALAADELCITPSALSHRIRLLEDFVGERLFIRDGRSVGLSEFGRRYLDVVRSALRTLTDFPMPHRSATVQPRVKVALPPTFARYLFIPRLAEFTRLHPDITVEVFLSVPLYDLSLSESDVEVRFAIPPPEPVADVLVRAEQAAFGAAGCGINWKHPETRAAEGNPGTTESVFRGDTCNCQARVRRDAAGRVTGLALRSNC